MEIGRGGEIYNPELCSQPIPSRMFVVMNKDTWNSLPVETQKIIEKINEEWIAKQAALWDEIDKSGLEFVSKRGHNIISLPGEQQERWVKAVRPLLDDYVNRMKAKGLPGDEVVEVLFWTD